MANGSPRIVVVAPVYNEEALVQEFLRRLQSAMSETGIALVVIVDDGSIDATYGRVEEFSRNNIGGLRIRLIRLSRNFGHQKAILAGLSIAHQYACENNIEFIALMDADLQDRPEHIGNLLSASDDSDVVYAVRASRGEGWVFRNITKLFHRLLTRGAEITLPRDAGTFSLMRTFVVKVILDNADTSPYFPGIRAWVGFRQRGVAVDRDARYAGTSRVGVFGLCRLALRAVFSYSVLPLRMITLLAMITFVLSTCAASIMIFLKLFGMVEIQGVALIVVSIFWSLGVQSVYLLVIAYMLHRSASESSKQKPYIIMEDRSL